LLFSLTWVMRLTMPLFEAVGRGFSGRDLILVAGGLFLLAKSTHEIHSNVEEGGAHVDEKRATSFAGVIAQIFVLDIVFSLDSVITAIGMADQLWVRIAAVVVAVVFMMAFSGVISEFVHRHPTIKMLALAFLLMIGLSLVAEGLGQHIPKGYIYFAMAFSVFVEVLNLRVRHGADPAPSGR
jgi:predicted tellurium resistance membrane protein TerC